MAWQTLDQQNTDQRNNEDKDRSSDIADIARMLMVARGTDPMTMLGMGIGRWLGNYLRRGWKRKQDEAYNKTKGTTTTNTGGTQRTMGDNLPAGAGPNYGRPNQSQVAPEGALPQLFNEGFGNQANPQDYAAPQDIPLALTRGMPFVGTANQDNVDASIYNPYYLEYLGRGRL